MVTFWLVVALIVILIIWYVITYNHLQRSKIHTEEAWSQIDVQLKRRNDLIPNLIATVKGYAKHEQDTFAKVVELRNQLTAVPEEDHQEKMAVADQLTSSLKSVFALAESYPDLKANTEFEKLMEELSNTENKIAYSRQLYNSTAARYNEYLVTFPSNFVAHRHHFDKVSYLEVPTEEKDVPKVSFD